VRLCRGKKKKNYRKKAGGVAQGVGPVLKLQYRKKKKKKEKEKTEHTLAALETREGEAGF
jgi:hypothetical protein